MWAEATGSLLFPRPKGGGVTRHMLPTCVLSLGVARGSQGPAPPSRADVVGLLPTLAHWLSYPLLPSAPVLYKDHGVRVGVLRPIGDLPGQGGGERTPSA